MYFANWEREMPNACMTTNKRPLKGWLVKIPKVYACDQREWPPKGCRGSTQLSIYTPLSTHPQHALEVGKNEGLDLNHLFLGFHTLCLRTAVWKPSRGSALPQLPLLQPTRLLWQRGRMVCGWLPEPMQPDLCTTAAASTTITTTSTTTTIYTTTTTNTLWWTNFTHQLWTIWPDATASQWSSLTCQGLLHLWRFHSCSKKIWRICSRGRLRDMQKGDCSFPRPNLPWNNWWVHHILTWKINSTPKFIW